MAVGARLRPGGRAVALFPGHSLGRCDAYEAHAEAGGIIKILVDSSERD